MNKKTIKKIIEAKFNDWIETIKDEKVKELVTENTIITGGCITSMLLGEKPKDYDIYFANKETTKAVAEYYVKLFNLKHGKVSAKNDVPGGVTENFQNLPFVLDGEKVEMWKAGLLNTSEVAPGYENQGGEKYEQNLQGNSKFSHMITNCEKDRIKIIIRSKGVASEQKDITDKPFEDVYDVLDEADKVDNDMLEDKEEKEKYRPIFLSSNAITLSDKIQCVIRFYGNPEEIHMNYDFAHCTNYWTSKDGQLILNPKALEATLAKELVYQGSKYPVCSILRTRKFVKRGWTVNAGQLLKIMFQISKLDLSNIDTLEDQLCGVDSAYFTVLIDALRNKQATDPKFTVEESYVASIIDKIF